VRATQALLVAGALIAGTLTAGTTACGGPSRPREPTPTSATSSGASSAAVDAPVVVESSGRVVARVGAAREVALGSALLPVAESARVLVVATYAGEPLGFAQLADASGPVGPILTFVDEHPAFVYETQGKTTVVTSSRARLCPLTVEGERVTRGSCWDRGGDALVAVDGKLALLDVRPKTEDDDLSPEERARHDAGPKKPAKPEPKPAATKKPSTKKPSTKKPRKGGGRPGKITKIPSEAQIKTKLFSTGRELVLDAHWLAPAPEPDEPVATGLRFREAMTGMGFIGAGVRNRVVDVAFYEKNDKPTKEPEGRLGYAQLDATLHLDLPTRRSFGESKMNPGFLSDHADMRLLTLPEGSLLFGLRGPRGRCDVTFVGPFVMQLIPDDPACTLDPQRLVATARARHKGQPLELPAIPALEAARVKRTVGQAAFDVGRVVYAGAQRFTFDGSRLLTFDDGTAPREVKVPLVARRSQLLGSAVAPDGDVLAATDEGLFVGSTLSVAAGATSSLSEARAPVVPGLGTARRDVAERQRRAAVKIGDGWWQAEGELRALTPEVGATVRALADGAEVVVGGATRGMLLTHRSDRAGVGYLDVAHLDAAGSLADIGSHAVALGPRFDAVARREGGAIGAGRSRSGLTTFALDAAGALLATRTLAVPQGDDGAELDLSPLPAGGALVTPRSRRWVVWLDDAGAELGRAAWLSAALSPCVDGHALYPTYPSPQPGELVTLSPDASEVAPRESGRRLCTRGLPTWLASGELAWVGTRSDGPDSVVVAVKSEVLAAIREAPAGGRATEGTTGAPMPCASGACAARPCPSEMVLTQRSVCVDRFEGALADVRGTLLSPDYPATPELFAYVLSDWATRRERGGDVHARALPLPLVGAGERSADALRALSLGGVRPSGTVTGKLAKQACEAVGKRLCTTAEWQRACRGEKDTLFPYGTTYDGTACNSRTRLHPAATLHDHAGMGHHDPRLNRVVDPESGHTLLRVTGSLPRCASVWGDDALFDMVGNLDEWVDEKGGGFAGGFYARGSEAGCESLITVHPPAYSDYSTGIRCCKDAAP
jgi:hypothetical protein